MVTNKAKKIQKIFCIGLGICCTILGLILCMLLFSTSDIAINQGIALNVMIILALAVYFLLPVVGIIFLVIIIMYIIQMKKFHGKKLKMILEFVIPIALIVLILIATFYTYINFFTQYFYRTLAIINIFIIIFMYIKVSKQFKYIVQENLKEVDEKVQESEVHKFSRENKKKIIIFAAIVLVILAIIVLIIFAINSDNKSKLIENNNINHVEVETNEIVERAGQTYFVNENQGFKINLSNFWRDRYQVEILKTNNGGTTWEKVDSNLTEVYIETEFMFLDANIGFVHDPYGGIDSYDIVKMTNDGGKTWNNLKINKPDIITENNIFFKGLPTENNGELSIIAYTVDSGRMPKYKYFKFVSDDMGETWEFVKELD